MSSYDYEDLEQEECVHSEESECQAPIDYETFNIEFDDHREFSACYRQLEKLLKFYFKRSEVKIEFVKDEKDLTLSLRAHTSNRTEIQEIKTMITWAIKRASQSFQSVEHEVDDDDDEKDNAKGRDKQGKSTTSPTARTNKTWAYEVLELSGAADLQSIRKSYLRLMKDFHPDKFIQGTPAMRKLVEDKVKEINAAYELLNK